MAQEHKPFCVVNKIKDISKASMLFFLDAGLNIRGVGFFLDESLSYTVLEKTSTEAFQVLWVEMSFVNVPSSL